MTAGQSGGHPFSTAARQVLLRQHLALLDRRLIERVDAEEMGNRRGARRRARRRARFSGSRSSGSLPSAWRALSQSRAPAERASASS